MLGFEPRADKSGPQRRLHLINHPGGGTRRPLQNSIVSWRARDRSTRVYNCVYKRRPTVRLIQQRVLVQRHYGNFIDCKTTKSLIVSPVSDGFESWKGRRLISGEPGAGKRPRSAARATYSHMWGRGQAYLRPPHRSTHTCA